MGRFLLMVLGVLVLFGGSGFCEARNTEHVSELVTNYTEGWIPSENVSTFSHRQRIFDLGMVVYSKWFADKYGYSYDNVSEELSEGMHVMEFRMKTVGGFTACYLNVLLENDLGLDMPERSYITTGGRVINGTFVFPRKREELRGYGPYGYVETPENKQYREEILELVDGKNKESYYNMNTRLVSKNGSDSQFIEEYNNRYYENMDYLTIGLYCNDRRFRGKKPELWLKKKSAKSYSLPGAKESKKDFLRFRIPKKIADSAVEYIGMEGPDYHFQTIKLKEVRRKYRERIRLGLPKEK